MLAERLADRLTTRRVAVHLDTEAVDLTIHEGRVVAVRTPTEERPARAVVNTVHPWQLHGRLQHTLGRPRRLRAAYAPVISHELERGAVSGVREILELTAAGIPQLRYQQTASPRAWSRPRTTSRPRTSTTRGASSGAASAAGARRPYTHHRLGGVYQAGSFSSAGRGTSQVLLAAALAAYAVQDSG